MRSGGSLLFLFWGAFLLWSPLIPVSGLYYGSCKTVPDLKEQCGKHEERFFYNFTSNQCQPFTYYGCTNNRNRFYTLEQCEQFCGLIDYCQLAPDSGPCYSKKPRWFYDPNTQSCKNFTYGGCLGNYNNFKTRLTCHRKCPKRGCPFRGGKLGLHLRAKERGMNQDEARRTEPPATFERKGIQMNQDEARRTEPPATFERKGIQMNQDEARRTEPPGAFGRKDIQMNQDEARRREPPGAFERKGIQE